MNFNPALLNWLTNGKYFLINSKFESKNYSVVSTFLSPSFNLSAIEMRLLDPARW